MNSPLFIYNTLSKSLETFKPLVPNKVAMYVCGVTVYDLCHMGHARAYVAFDTIRRYLEHKGYEVNYIQNFTDIDDKIIRRGQEQNLPFNEITEKYIQAYHEDMEKLNIKKATQYPKATDYISQIIQLIETLIEKGYAYEENGEVCFDVKKDDDYGKLSKKVLEDLFAGARVDVSSTKRNPLDFVLWKPSKEGEPFWESPWGSGRPGWHIECSAMAMDILGESIDIHGGGQDLIFPHHENEICQSECATGKPFATYWLHNGFVNINNEKMSKSLGNFFTLRESLKEFDGQTIRFFLQKMHYRSPLNFSLEGIKEADTALKKLKTCVANNKKPLIEEQQEEAETLKEKFYKAMNEDFNYAESIGVLFEMSKLINRYETGTTLLEEHARILGLALETKHEEMDTSMIEEWIQKRATAKQEKNYQEADRIRDLLLNEHKIIIEDTPEGVRWKTA